MNSVECATLADRAAVLVDRHEIGRLERRQDRTLIVRQLGDVPRPTGPLTLIVDIDELGEEPDHSVPAVWMQARDGLGGLVRNGVGDATDSAVALLCEPPGPIGRHAPVRALEGHANRVMMKLGVRDRAQLVVLAYENGLIQPGSEA